MVIVRSLGTKDMRRSLSGLWSGYSATSGLCCILLGHLPVGWAGDVPSFSHRLLGTRVRNLKGGKEEKKKKDSLTFHVFLARATWPLFDICPL